MLWGAIFLLLLAASLVLTQMPQPVRADGNGSSGAEEVNGYTVISGIVYDGASNPVQLRGVNWFGFETGEHVVHGLWARNWQSMITQMKELGFNAVRLPVCPATLQASGVSSVDYSKNPDLNGKNSLEVLDMVMAKLDAEGMYILVDHHRPDCNAISELWYTNSYSEQQWIDDLVFMAERYSSLPHFFAIDLKNEPHGAATWGTGNPATDWKLAAEKAGSAVLAANPNLLVFVEGVQENPVCSDGANHWWGGNLEPQECHPLDLPADKLVLSPHVYGPDVFNQPYFNDGSFPANMPAIWEEHFGQFASNHAVILGEFGGRYGHGGDAKDKAWQDALVDYLISKGMRSAFYWSWNPNSGDTGGILQDDWTNVWTDKVELLDRLWGDGTLPTPMPTNTPTPMPTDMPTDVPTSVPTGVPTDIPTMTPMPGQTPTPTLMPTGMPTTAPTMVPTAPPEDVACTTDYTIHSDWGNGFVTTVTLTNSGGSAWNGWAASWRFDGNQQITALWNGSVSQNGQTVAVHNAAWNGAVAAGGSVSFGFVAAYSGSNPVPAPVLINGVACTPSAAGVSVESSVALLAAGESARLSLTGESEVLVEIPGAAVSNATAVVLLRDAPPPHLGGSQRAVGGYLRLITARMGDAMPAAPAASYTITVQAHAGTTNLDGATFMRWDDGTAIWEALPTTPVGGTAVLDTPAFSTQETHAGLFALAAQSGSAGIFLPIVMQ